jgi:hypothetical protein
MLAGDLNDAHQKLLDSFAGLSDEEMTEPGVAGDWSVRDILAHLTAWDRETTEMFRAMLQGERPSFLDLDEEGIEAFNKEHHSAMLGGSVSEAVSGLIAAREELVALLKEVDNAKLFAPAPGDEHADLSIAACISVTADHEEEHAEMIETWREGRGEA